MSKNNLEPIEIHTPTLYEHIVVNGEVIKTDNVLKEAQVIKINTKEEKK